MSNWSEVRRLSELVPGLSKATSGARVGDDVVEVLGLRPRGAVRDEGLVLELHHRVAAARGDGRLADRAGDRVATVAQHVVPEDLDALLRDRERDALARVDDAIAARSKLRRGRDALGRVVDARRNRGTAARRVDVHLERRVGGEHLLVALAQHVGVLGHVGARDGVERLVGGERVEMMAAGLEAREAGLGRGIEAAFPCRDRARGVGALLGAAPVAGRGARQNAYRMVVATKSRSLMSLKRPPPPKVVQAKSTSQRASRLVDTPSVRP